LKLAVRFVTKASRTLGFTFRAERAIKWSPLFDNSYSYCCIEVGDPSLLRWILKPDDAPAAVLFGGSNVEVAVTIEVNEEGVIHLFA